MQTEEVVERAEAEKEKRAWPMPPQMTDSRKELFVHLLKDGYFLLHVARSKDTNIFKVYDAAINSVAYYHESTICTQTKDLLAFDKESKRYTLDMEKVKLLHNRAFIKKKYLEKTGEVIVKKKKVVKNTKPILADDITLKSATIVDCYRYTLSRIWNKDKPKLMFIMLNPSTADGTQDDPTIKSCMRIARAQGYGGINVGNLFAFRATDPTQLWENEEVLDKVGPENDVYLQAMSEDSEHIIFAWGTNGRYQSRNEVVEKMFPFALCLKKTKDGFPQHPLYIKGVTIPVNF